MASQDWPRMRPVVNRNDFAEPRGKTAAISLFLFQMIGPDFLLPCDPDSRSQGQVESQPPFSLLHSAQASFGEEAQAWGRAVSHSLGRDGWGRPLVPAWRGEGWLPPPGFAGRGRLLAGFTAPPSRSLTAES